MAYWFMQSYADNFDFEKSLSLESFSNSEKDLCFKKTWDIKKWFSCTWYNAISSNSWLRKIYDSYLDKILDSNNNKKIALDIWFAKIWYQEKRELLPVWFLSFFEEIFRKVEKYDSEKKYENFKDFLEVFLAYHKYFNPSAK